MSHPRKKFGSQRREEGHWIWGFHSVEACLEAHPELVLDLIFDKSSRAEDAQALKKIQQLALESDVSMSAQAMPKILAERRHQGVAAKVKSFGEVHFGEARDDLEGEIASLRPSSPSAASLRDAVAASSSRRSWAWLDGIEDPRNYGAILRSAAAFGVDTVFVRDREQAPLSGVVLQASAGQAFRVKIVIVSSPRQFFDFLKDHSIEMWALDARGESLLTAVREAPSLWVWVVGAEGTGIRPQLLELCQKKLRIEMQNGVESLNASAAATLAFFAGNQLGL